MTRRLLLIAIAFIVALPAADLGPGPVPTSTTLLTPGPIGSTTPSSGAFTTLTASTSLGVTGGFATMDVAGGLTRGLKWGATACQMVLYDDGSGTPYIDYQGSNTDISLNVRTKGAGILRLLGGGTIVGGSAGGALVGAETLRCVGAGYFDGAVTTASTTDSTSKTTGSVIASGGIGVAKNLVASQGLGWGVTSVVTAAGTTTLTTASTSVQVFTGTTTQTVTLPAANAFGAGVGYVLTIKNVSTGIVTVNRAGADTINDAASVTTKAVASFASLRLVSDGVSAWEVL